MDPNQKDSQGNNPSGGDKKKPKGNIVFAFVAAVMVVLIVSGVYN